MLYSKIDRTKNEYIINRIGNGSFEKSWVLNISPFLYQCHSIIININMIKKNSFEMFWGMEKNDFENIFSNISKHISVFSVLKKIQPNETKLKTIIILKKSIFVFMLKLKVWNLFSRKWKII